MRQPYYSDACPICRAEGRVSDRREWAVAGVVLMILVSFPFGCWLAGVAGW